LTEIIIELGPINPIDIYGVNDTRLRKLENKFPTIKLVARGNTLKAMGADDTLKVLQDLFEKLLQHHNKYNKITDDDFTYLAEVDNETTSTELNSETNSVIVFGNSGLVVKARTPNQQKLVESVKENDMIFALGPAGTGKTYTAVALAVKALKDKEVKKIILTRPAVEAGENLGFLPGDLKEKLDPYIQPLYDALRDMIPAEKLATFMESGVIQIAPLAFMRGRTLDNAFVILDEAQNATQSQMKMFLTRMGKTAKFIITGDATQIDLPHKQPSGLLQAMRILHGIKGIDFITFDTSDVIRHRLVKQIIIAYEKE
jgi:phosphate starvation-inducible protein PhoH and related proteins